MPGIAEVVRMARTVSEGRSIHVSPVTLATRFGPYPAGPAGPDAVTLGFRPEDAGIARGGEAPAGSLSLDAEVEAVEPVGAESFLYCAAAGSRIVVRVAGRALARPGERLRVVAPADRLHWFGADERRID